MRKVVKALLILLGLILGLPLLAVGAGLVWINTGHGRATLENLAARQVPGLSLQGLQGPLPGHLGIARLAYADADGTWLEVEGARIDLDLRQLLHGELRIAGIRADRLRLHRLPAGDGEPTPPNPPPTQVLPQLPALPLAVNLGSLRVAQLELGAAILGQPVALALDGSAQLRHGELAARLAAQRQDAPGALRLDLALAPGQDRLTAALDASEPAGGILASLTGQPTQPFQLSLRLNGPASGAELRLDASLGPEITARATGTISAAPDGAMAADVRADVQPGPLLPPDIRPLATPLRLEGKASLSAASLLRLQDLRLTTPAGEVTADGTLSLAAEEAVALRIGLRVAEAARFAPLLPAGLGWQGWAGTVEVAGTLSHPRLRLDVAPDGLATGTPQLDAALGRTPRITADLAWPEQQGTLRIAGAASSLDVSGTAAEVLDLRASLIAPQLAALGPGMEGALSLRATATGPRGDPAITVEADTGRIAAAGQVLEDLRARISIATPFSAPRAEGMAHGSWQGLPLRLDLDGQPEGQRLRLHKAEASLGPARLAASGLLDPSAPLLEGEALLEVPDLAPLGRVAQAALSGRMRAQAVLRRAEDGQQGFTLRLDAPAIGFNGQAGKLDARAEGTPNAFTFATEGGWQGASFAARGALAPEAAGRVLQIAQLNASGAGETLRLASPARITLLPDGGIGLGDITLATGRGGRVQARGQWGPERADITATIASLPLALANAVAPDLALRGALSGDVRVTGAVAEPAIRARLQGNGLRSDADWARGLPSLGLRAEAGLQGQVADARVALDAGAAGRVTASANLPQGFGAAAPLRATLDGQIDLGALAQPFLAAGADRVTGRMALALTAGGRLDAPQLGGRAVLSGGSYRNAVTGVSLNDIAGTLRAENTRLVLDGITARTAGNGSITLTGSIDAGAASLPTALRLQARQAQPVASDTVTAQFDADLRLDGPLLGNARLGGQVTLNNAEIRVPEHLPSTLPQLANVRTRGTPPPGSAIAIAQRQPATAPDTSGLPPIALDVTLRAPRRVFVRGRGLDVELGGDLAIGGTLTAPAVQGELKLLRGTLDILSRRLTFDRGSIAFPGGTLVPQLNLTATSQAGDTAITVTVSGAASKPEITFSSSPELPQDEILARLLFSRGTSSLSPFEIAQIAEALARLSGASSGPGVLGRVRSALGLDRLGVANGQNGTAALEAGRYLMPGVYVGVTQGSTGQTGVAVQVEITPRLRLEGQTATGPAGDRLGLSYEMEY